MILTRDQARQAFADAGLTYDDLTPTALCFLRTLVAEAVKDAGLFGGTFRVANRFYMRPGPHGPYRYLTCRAQNFDVREAISFNADGFIGFAGWADSQNVQPILQGFTAWVEIIKLRRV